MKNRRTIKAMLSLLLSLVTVFAIGAPIFSAVASDANSALGDVNEDGAIDQFDYIMAKRAYFGTYTYDEEEAVRGDVNEDGSNDQFDYILIKRHYFGTYVIGSDGTTPDTDGPAADTSEPEKAPDDFDIVIDANAPTSLAVSKVNEDAGGDAIAIWTEAGTKLREVLGTEQDQYSWEGNGWRYYIVVDSAGRIAYAVLYPANGYGDPNKSGYYCNSYYSDYTNNPAIVLLDGYAEDYGEGNGYQQYEIVVPEGGFAITAHGDETAVKDLIDMLSQGTADNYDISNVNTRSIYHKDLRLTCDADAKTVSLLTVEVENGLYITMPQDRPLKIAQFADLHFGVEGLSYQNDKTARTKEYMKQVAAEYAPDLIVCSGDNIMTTGVEGLAEFVALMDSLETPWTFIYGNHDAESDGAGYRKKDLSDYLENCDSPYLIYSAGYVEEANNRYGNFSISVLNASKTKLLGAILFFDAGGYLSAYTSYEAITEGQIAWYESEIDKLNENYEGDMIPSMVFSHIQLPEFYTAYVSALNGTGAEFIIEQSLSASSINGIKTGGPTYTNTGLFDVMVEKGSTKAYFVGHAHTLGFQVKMDGITMGFGPQSGFSTNFENNDLLRRSYVYNFNPDFSFTTTVALESGENVGLTYFGTYDGSADYDTASGTYSATLGFNYGHYIQFGYKGVRLNWSEITFTGDVADTEALANGEKLYKSSSNALMYKGTKARNFTFTFDPAAMTVNVVATDIPIDPDAPTSLSVTKINSDAGANAIAVWTESGTKIRTVTDASTGAVSWVGNEWRYFIIVDGEGRIAYAVVFPESGYGGPSGPGYYCNSYYTDYTKNPAISLLDGYANDYGTGIGYKLFEIVVPEGGFAITSHGTTNYDLVDMLSQGTVVNYDISNINTRSVYNSNIRVTYDETEKTVSIYTVE